MPIYDLPIAHHERRKLPQISLNERHKYVKDSAFQTSFTGKLTDEAIHRYSLEGRYGSVAQARAEAHETGVQARKNVKKLTVKTINHLANKYVDI